MTRERAPFCQARGAIYNWGIRKNNPGAPMRLILLVFILSLPTIGLAQSLGEVAKKERERREKNKEEGKKALTFTETEIFGEEEEQTEGVEGVEGDVGSDVPRTSTADEFDYTMSESESDSESGSGEDAPKSIPPDIPMDARLEMFQRMKDNYERQVRELDGQIAENNKKIAALDEQIRTASSSGGAGLPVAPTSQGSDQLYTGQESETLLAEQNKLKTLNERLEARKGQLKSNLIAQGRIANIPAGYLRF